MGEVRLRLPAPVSPPKVGVVTPAAKARTPGLVVSKRCSGGQVAAQLQRALRDQRVAGIGVGVGQGPRAAAHLRHSAPSGDHAAIGLVAVVGAGDQVGRRQLNVSGPAQRRHVQVGVSTELGMSSWTLPVSGPL